MILFITIESLGKTGVPPRLWRWSTHPGGAWDTLGVYVPALELWPSEVASSFEPRANSETAGTLSATLSAVAAVRTALYDQIPAQIDTLQTSVTRTGTTLNLARTDLLGTTILIGREAMRLAAHLGSGSYTVVRGILDTDAQPHNVDGDVAVFDAATFPVTSLRRVTLGRINPNTATSYDDEEVLETYVLSNISAPSPDIIPIGAESILSALKRARVCTNLWKPRATPNDIANAYGPRLFDAHHDSKRPDASTGNLSLSINSGDAAIHGATYVATTGGGCAVYFDADDRDARSVEIPDDVSSVHEFYRCSSTSEDAATFDSLPLSANVFTTILQLLHTSPTGENHDPAGANYDLGIDHLGAGIPWMLIDTASIENARAEAGVYAWRDTLSIGFDGKPVNLYAWIKKRLAPFGASLIPIGGKLTVVQLRDVAPANATALTQTHSITRQWPSQARRLTDPIDRIEYLIDDLYGADPIVDALEDAFVIGRNPLTTGQVVQFDLSGIAADRRWVARALARRHQNRWRVPIPQIDMYVLATSRVRLGDVVTLTHAQVYQPTGGAKSVNAVTCQVIAVRESLETSSLWVRLLYVGAVYNRPGRIAPAARVVSYDAGTRTFTLSPNAFSSGDGPYATDAAAFANGMRVDLCDPDHTVVDTNMLVKTVDGPGNTVTLSALASTPAGTPNNTQILMLSEYDTQTAGDVQDFWAFLSDANQTLGAASDDPHEWSI